jgi:hypothetical protein
VQTFWAGTLKKMRVEATDPVTYWLSDGFFDPGARSSDHRLNAWLGLPVEIAFNGQITCVYCGRPTKKSFGQGFCYPCFQARAEADICIVKPELCHYFEQNDPCRDDAFAQSHCFQPHVLYAALTSGHKVGITRKHNIPARWIDQGAIRAVPLAEMASRREVGLIEHRLARDFPDRTHWMRMLKLAEPEHELVGWAAGIVQQLEQWSIAGILPASERQERRFRYPVLQYPDKVASFNLDNTARVGGVLLGIKGQYLIFDRGVINLRKFTGYAVEVSGEPG